MKAAILTNIKQPLVIDDLEMPNKLELGQVLVKIFILGQKKIEKLFYES